MLSVMSNPVGDGCWQVTLTGCATEADAGPAKSAMEALMILPGNTSMMSAIVAASCCPHVAEHLRHAAQ